MHCIWVLYSVFHRTANRISAHLKVDSFLLSSFQIHSSSDRLRAMCLWAAIIRSSQTFLWSSHPGFGWPLENTQRCLEATPALSFWWSLAFQEQTSLCLAQSNFLWVLTCVTVWEASTRHSTATHHAGQGDEWKLFWPDSGSEQNWKFIIPIWSVFQGILDL